MNILIIPHSIWTGVPGRTDYFIKHLKKRNEVHILSWDMPYPLKLKNIIKKIKKSRERFTEEIEKNLILHHVSRPYIIPPFNKGAVNKQISEIVDEYEIDIIFSEAFYWDLVPPFEKIPVIYDVVDDHLSFFKDGPLLRKFIGKFSRVERSFIKQLNEAKKTVFVSSVLNEKYGIHTKSSSVISNGVDLQSFKNDKDRKYVDKFGLYQYEHVIGYVGYFGEWSNLYFTALHLKKFLDESNSVLVVAGIGPEIKKVKRKIDSERIIFTGMIPPKEIPSIMKTFDVGLLTFKKSSYTDSASPIKYFEYAAAGIKVLSSPLEEVKRINFNNTVFCNKMDELPYSLEKALSLDFDKKKLKSSLENYDWKVLSKNLLKIFKVYK
ncbi:MAG: glycosyltransferase [Methanothermobacter sp.]|nr:glycosyltransferase [Methanothermobacter sp.]